MNNEQIKKWIQDNLVMQDEARSITRQSVTGFNQSVVAKQLQAFVEFGTARKTRLYLRDDLEKYAKSKRIRPSKGANEMTLTELEAKMTDDRVKFFEEKGVYYAVVVEENGDEHDLARARDLTDLHQQLKDAGVAE